MWELIIIGVLAAVAGLVIGLLLKGREAATNLSQVKVLEAQIGQMKEQQHTEQERYKQNLQELRERSTQERETLEQMHQRQLQDKEEQIVKERTHADELRKASEQQWKQHFATVKEEIVNLATDQLSDKQSKLQSENILQISELLKPVQEKFDDFKKSVDEGKRQNDVNKTSIQDAFKSTMDLFAKAQEDAIRNLQEQTQRIGTDAENLTKALKGDSKVQGDWGEMVLQTLLENSGLHRDEEYFVQQNVKGEDNENFRPDIIVKIPGEQGGCVVIDSKVSLTDYANAVATDDETLKAQFLKKHVESVRKHVSELAAKKYEDVVGSIGFVLMFIPNEYSYIVAMRQDPSLQLEAYKKRVVIISPSNLLMALQLVYNLWQNSKQSKNVENIFKSAAALYDKVATLSETYKKLGTQLNTVNNTYKEALTQLCEGRGNVVRRVEDLRDMGVNPKKQNALLDKSSTDLSLEG